MPVLRVRASQDRKGLRYPYFCAGLPAQNYTERSLQSQLWHVRMADGEWHSIAGVHEDDQGDPYLGEAVAVRAEMDGKRGILVFGGDFGLVIGGPRGEGIPGEEPRFEGIPLLWVEDAEAIPKEAIRHMDWKPEPFV